MHDDVSAMLFGGKKQRGPNVCPGPARLRVWLLALHAVVLNADDTYDVADILYIHSQQQSDSTVLPHIPRSGGLVTRIFSMRTGLRPVALRVIRFHA